MYSCSRQYRDACESGRVIYASFYRALIMLNKIQLRNIDVKSFMNREIEGKFALYGCNDFTELFVGLCEKWDCKPQYLIESKSSRFWHMYPQYRMCEPMELKNNSEYIIVMSSYNFNEIAKQLKEKGYEYKKIISVEELLATMLCL